MSHFKTIAASLAVVVGAQFLGHFVGCATTGCVPEARSPIAECQAKARAEFYVGQRSADEAMAAYDACMAGLPDGGP